MTRAAPFAFLHGFAGLPSDWDEVRALVGSADATAPALLGHGADVSPNATFETEVDRIAAVLAPGAPVHLVGYSLGGRVALGVLAKHAPLVARATIFSASPGLTTDEERRARTEADARWVRLLERDGIERFLDEWDAQPLFRSRAAASAARLAARRARQLGHDPRALARAMRALGLGQMPAWLDSLEHATTPLTFVAGADDVRYVAAAERMARRARHAELRIVESTGHDVPFERPDVVAEIIRRGERR